MEMLPLHWIICGMGKRLSHLNFDYITSLTKQGLVRGLPKLKYQKDHLCSACDLVPNPPSCVDPQVPTVIASEPAVSTVIPLSVEEVDHDIDVAYMDNNPNVDFPIPEPSSEESSTQDYRFIRVPAASIKKFGMETCEPADTPMVKKSKLDEDPQGKAVDPTRYRGMIGTLMYLTSNTEHAGCQDTRKSTSKSMQLLGDRLVSWSSKKQKSTAISTTEAEYIALLGCYIRHHFIKEQVKNGVVKLYFVRTEYQLANIFTKPLARERLDFLINKLGMKSMSPETLQKLGDKEEE
ncbi:hypothetical protein Tco_0679152 [Tanacetum coccineum]|uniref:GAG-pre-integrase domain-containing protein n=1 Tax=Tanacetum coccineum TaxID=301880 RepID=A0ABQ4XH15_9ASTR